MRVRRLATVGVAAGAALGGIVSGAGVVGASGQASKGPSASQLLSSAVSATSQASSFTLNGTFRSGPTTLAFINVAVTGSGDGGGTIIINRAPVRIRVVHGTLYMNGASAFWRKQANPTVARKVAGRWVSAPVSTPALQSFGSVFNPKTLISQLGTSRFTNVAKGGTSTINGQKVTALTGKGPHGPAVIYVAATGNPYIIRVSATAGRVTFSNYNKTTAPTAPNGAVSYQNIH